MADKNKHISGSLLRCTATIQIRGLIIFSKCKPFGQPPKNSKNRFLNLKTSLKQPKQGFG